MDASYFEAKRQKAAEIYSRQRTIHSPYFKSDISLTSNGFHHLQFSDRHERSKEEQVLKFTLLPLGLKVLQQAATVQEYRKLLCPVGEKAIRDGSRPMKLVEWWGFVAIFIPQDIKIRVIVRKVGNGNFNFWSVMPYSKLGNRQRNQRLFVDGIEDD